MKYDPHDYQKYAVGFIKDHPVAAVLLDMGMGKSSITLTAVNDLMFDSFDIRKVLVVAPLRVAKNTWSAEIEKWDHLSDLKYSIAVGTAAERKKALQADADIYIINRENLPWLVEKSGMPFDYDMVVIDELSSFKNWQAKRFKALMKVRPKVKRIVGLTGTPSSNGLMDLFAEYKVLDMGERLGRFISQYRVEYFVPDQMNGSIVYSYRLRPGADKRIYDRISDIKISMKGTDHQQILPVCSFDDILQGIQFSVMDFLNTADIGINCTVGHLRQFSGQRCCIRRSHFATGKTQNKVIFHLFIFFPLGFIQIHHVF